MGYVFFYLKFFNGAKTLWKIGEKNWERGGSAISSLPIPLIASEEKGELRG